MERKGFSKEELFKTFEEIGARVGKPLEVFLLGGGAMAFRNQKPATKDLDLVVKKKQDAERLFAVLAELGFTEKHMLEREYAEMKAQGIWENQYGFRIDLFVNRVCNALELSRGVSKRSETFKVFGKLTIKILSNEDIILFKSITERADDANDIAAIVRMSRVNWDVILEEAGAQSSKRNWYGALYNKLDEIKEKHGINAPIMGKVLKLYREGLLQEAFALRLKKGMTREEALTDLKKQGFTKTELDKLRDRPITKKIS